MSGIYILLLGFITAFIVVLFSMPSLIKVAKLKNLVDQPGEDRKMHRWSIPTLGGIVIFGAIVFSYALWFPEDYIHINGMLTNFKYLFACLILLFFVGVKDDIIGTAPVKKLIAHIMVGFILVVMADIRIFQMHGIFGIHQPLALWQSYLLTIFVYIVIINSINLIDGLDGLAGLISLLGALFFGILFFCSGNIPLSLLAMVLCGTMLGFIFFNFSPARVFMGDAGSLSIGAIFCVLAINCINESYHFAPKWVQILNKPVLTMSIMSYPLFDVLRVFILRVIKGKSPFTADKNHIHHHFERLGIGHAKTSIILFVFSLLVVLFQVFIQIYIGFTNATLILFVQITFAFSLMLFVFLIIKKNKKSI
tara:strand:- start:2859 stop:3953 length:1095 start_codon:yes stop_codon:yes gene_type:complete